jgi:hypothetical protein
MTDCSKRRSDGSPILIDRSDFMTIINNKLNRLEPVGTSGQRILPEGTIYGQSALGPETIPLGREI